MRQACVPTAHKNRQPFVSVGVTSGRLMDWYGLCLLQAVTDSQGVYGSPAKRVFDCSPPCQGSCSRPRTRC